MERMELTITYNTTTEIEIREKVEVTDKLSIDFMEEIANIYIDDKHIQFHQLKFCIICPAPAKLIEMTKKKKKRINKTDSEEGEESKKNTIAKKKIVTKARFV